MVGWRIVLSFAPACAVPYQAILDVLLSQLAASCRDAERLAHLIEDLVALQEEHDLSAPDPDTRDLSTPEREI
jgi:hypothetical protein